MIAITNYYGIVVRLPAFARNGISIEDFVKETEATLMSQDEALISFGPCFGEEAGQKITARIEQLSFEYISDYFVFNFDMPDWIELKAVVK